LNDQLKEVLGRLTEECAEVIQAISKANIFGLETDHKGKTNQEQLQQEIADVLAIVIVMSEKFPELINNKALETGMRRKVAKLKRYAPKLMDGFDLDKALRKN